MPDDIVDWWSRVKVKNGVNKEVLNCEIRIAVRVAYELYKKLGRDLTLTSTDDGVHSAGSKHYINDAFDSRIWGMTIATAERLAVDARKQLGKHFDIVVEYRINENTKRKELSHIHWEYDFKV